MITNLLVNSIEALSGDQRLPGARHIIVGTSTVSGEQVEITVDDNGPGIEPAHRDHMFSGRYTTKAGNTGLGLSICLAIIRSHQGTIAFEPRDPHGARFRIRFPIYRLS
ncbi:Sensor protein ZraS [compost metagenome]